MMEYTIKELRAEIDNLVYKEDIYCRIIDTLFSGCSGGVNYSSPCNPTSVKVEINNETSTENKSNEYAGSTQTNYLMENLGGVIKNFDEVVTALDVIRKERVTLEVALAKAEITKISV